MKRTHPDDGATPGSAALHRPAEERLPGHAAQVDRNILESLVVYRYTVRVADGRPVKTTQSPECATVTGYTAEEFAADPDLWIRMVAPEDRELVRQRVQEILAGREIPPIEHRIRRKDGALRWVCDTIILHRDDRGRLVSYDGIIQDITARQQWEEERLRVSEERYRSLFESSRDSIMTLAPPSWKFTSGNPATVKMFGVAHEAEFIAHGPWELSPARQPDGRASDEKAREMIATALREGSHFFEWTHQRINGEAFPATVLLSRIESPGKVLLQATVRDITARKQAEAALHAEIESREKAEAALRESEERLSMAIMGSGQGLWDWNFRSGETYLSPRYYELIGYREGEVHPDLAFFNSLVHPDDYPTVTETMAEHLEGRSEYSTIEYRRRRKSGEYKWTRGVGRVVERDETGAPLRMVGTITDISERKAAEVALRELNENLERLVTERTDELRRSEEQYRDLVTGLDDGLFAVDGRGLVTFANPALARLLGYEQTGSIMGRNFMEFVAPEMVNELAGYFRQAVASGQSREVSVVEFIRPDGTRTVGEYGATAVMEGGRVVGMRGVVRDITERKRAEAQLHLFRCLLDESTDSILVVNPATARIVDVNHAVCRNLGYSREELLALRVMDIEANFTDLAAFARNTEQLKAAGAFRFEGRQRRKDGSTFPVGVSVRYISRPEGDFSLAIARDITERKRAAEEIRQLNADLERRVDERTASLRESEERFRHLAETMPDAVLVGQDGKNVYANPAAARLLRAAAPEALLGLDMFAFIDPARREAAGRQMQRVLAGEKLPPFEDSLVRCDGSLVTVEISTCQFVWQGRPALQMIARDITARKQAEELLRKEHEKLTTLYNAMVGRELRFVDLKEEINRLCAELGREPKYPPVWRKEQT